MLCCDSPSCAANTFEHFDTGEGQQAVLFADQEEAAAWEERHPEAAQAVQGGVPVVGRRAAARAAAAEPHL